MPGPEQGGKEPPGQRLDSFLSKAAKALEAAGVEAARREARLLLAEALGMPQSAVFAQPERPLSQSEVASAERLLSRRLAGEPLSRIRGKREFWSLEFTISPDTLDPRPDSEVLVESVLAALPDRAAPLRILDLGTGSGCLLLALLSELPNARGLGVDCSAAALDTARANAQSLGLASRVEFRKGNWAQGLEGGWDAVISNPPYIASVEVEQLEDAVRLYDPPAALDGGDDGLDAYRAILPDIRRLLKPGGLLALEMGWQQEAALRKLLGQQGFEGVQCHLDLGGRARCLTLRMN